MSGQCKYCGEFIRWVNQDGRNVPVDANGKLHRATCAKADSFRKRTHVVIIASPKFYPLLDDLKEFLEDIEKAGDADSYAFVERLLLAKEDKNLPHITQEQFEWLERLWKRYAE